MKRLLPTLAMFCLVAGQTHAGLVITASPTPLAPPKDDISVLVHHATDDKGGNTSLRFVENRKVDENKYPTNGITVFAKAGREQPQRDRDLGQTFLAGDQRVKLDALYLRVGHAELAALSNAPGARIAVSWFEVTGEPRLNDHGTPGFAGRFDRLASPELDDYIEGETYEPLRVSEGRLPGTFNQGDYLKLDFTGEDEFTLEPHRTYAFLLMFLHRAPQRGMTLANEYYGTYIPDPTNRLRGHGIRREGFPAFPDDWKTRLKRPPGTLGFPDVCTFRDLWFVVTVKSEQTAVRQTAPAHRQAPVDFNHPPRDYATHRMHGWEVLVEMQLAEEAPELATAALARLEKKLGEITTPLPRNALPDLRQLKVFLMHGPQAKAGGRTNGLEYFRSDAPRHHDWLDARMASSIVIFNAANYAKLTEHWALKSLMHEFGHAKHLEHWPEDRADIICAATSTKTPVFADTDLKAGVHINGVGSYHPTMQDIPTETVLRARVVVDHRESALAEAGDLRVPIQQGRYSADRIAAELGEIVSGTKPGRADDTEITFFKSVGVAIQDLAAATRILANAQRLGLGTTVQL